MHISALRLDDGELLIIITPDATASAISDYAQRWGIETAEDGRRQVLDLKSREPSTLRANLQD
ncbi:MAG: hypothetical protein QNJ72_37615 [Pleurocapsa sp. MO_226.B13]|nr:hypothetical protein [Pleurocapsa sp. MO_226.B13]